jgi:FKBP-type peptidyl-prolyl cis-trans isomerase
MKRAIAAFVAVGLIAVALHAQDAQKPPQSAAQPQAQQQQQEQPEKRVTESGLTIIELDRRDEPLRVQPGDQVWVHYTGTYPDGKKFDSSHDRGRPLNFMVGWGRVIKGWDEGLQGMQVGDKRQLIIPPHLAYGEQGMGEIPGKATLHFEVELVGIERREGRLPRPE